MQANRSNCNDQTFAQLTDMFGESVSTEMILLIGREHNWKLDKCIDQLVKFNASRASNFGNNASNAYDDDADVVIESEEIQPSAIVNQSTVSNMLPNADEEKRTQWSSNMSFASTLQQPNVGFSVTNSGFNHNNRTGSPQVKQPRLAPHAIEKHPNVPEIIREIEKNNRILICMRGAPGSGKSYLAHSIIDKTMHGDYANHIFSTDDFFLNPRTKRYCFDRSRLSEAHDTNQNRVAQRAMNGWSPIIVDNTNMQLWEMFPYFREATRNGYIIKILEPKTPWRISVGKLAQRNKHNVDQETIARMLEKYEPGSVQDVLRAMQIHNYKMEPKLRNFPEIVEQPKQADQPTPMYNWSNVHGQSNENSRFTPREQRPRKQGSDRKQTEAFDADTFETIFKKLGNVQEDWPAYEEEQGSFWNSEAIAKPKPDQNIPKPQRKPSGNASASDMYNLLVDSKKKTKKDKRKDSDHAELTKHKKNCPNENKSFQAIRQIYPTIPVSLLWDLFEKCNGDGDWTMDILLNESETKELQTLNTQSEIDQDDFGCYCDNPLGGPSVSNPDLTQAAIAIPNEWLKDSRANALPPRGSRRPKNNINESEVRKQIEEQFVISDDRYSEHTRKIRNLRRGAAATTVSHEASNNDRNAEAVDTEEINEDDEMIQMDLGIELVCQLDQTFGSSTFQHNGLKDIKTTVFMPKTLGQQLYAIWVESLYNQIEEQRQQSYKADEEFARELQVKQPQSSIFEVPPKPNIQNIADMEYTWKAYRTEPNEWKQTTPEDLATKLTKAKLFEIFPNVDREQLIDVFSTYGNKFAKTVDFFKESLKSEIDDKMQSNGQELVTQARNEAQAIRPPVPNSSKPIAHKIQESQQMDKMDIEEAKRVALKVFEENRNLAMHHSHLKAECYNKARDAFQRKQPGVAYYYINVANLHNTKIDTFNNNAANAIVEVHSYTQQNPDMLDLHYLHGDEAIECLDIYLDKHIKQLKDAVRGFKYVFIITGRGLHSTGGFSTIKHRVKCRLKQRSLSWAEVNPGLLKVKLQYISLFVHDINKNVAFTGK